MKIKTTLIASSGLMIAGLALVAFLSVYSLGAIRNSINGLTARSTPLQIKTTELQKVVEGLSANLMQMGVASDPEEVRQLSTQIEGNRKQLESIVSEIGRLDSARSGQVDIGTFRTLHETVQKAVETRLRNISLFKEDTANVDAALALVEKALGGVSREMSQLSSSAGKRVTSAVSSSSQLFASSNSVRDMMLNLREVPFALTSLELAKSRIETISVRQKIKLVNGNIQDIKVDDPTVGEVKKEVAKIYEDFVRPGDGLIALRTEIIAGKNVDAKFQTIKRRHINTIGEFNLKLSTVLDQMEKKVNNNRSEVESSLGVGQQVSVIGDAVNNIIGYMKSLEAKTRLLMLTDNEKSYEKTVGELRQIQDRLKSNLSGTRKELARSKQNSMLRSMDGAITAFSRAEASLERIVNTQKSIIESTVLVAKTVAAVKESTKKEVLAGEVLVKETSSNQERTVASVNSMVNRQMIIILTLSAVVAVVALLGAFFTYRRVCTSLEHMTEMLKDVAQGEGDLTKRLDDSSKDEFGEASRWFNTFIEKLSRTMTEVARNTEQLTSSAGQLRGTAAKIAAGSEQVADQAGAVATASEQMSATSMDIAHNCQMASDISRTASEYACSGAKVVDEAISGMDRISNRVKNSAVSMQQLGDRSEQISQIINTIEDIADQTNLLALNAAIEAARAGDQGRGFAVVADEVRALAVRTTEATAEISTVIKGIVAEISVVVRSMEQGVGEAEFGMKAATESGEALKQIITQIDTVCMQIAQVATAAEEQTATTGEITANIAKITDVVGATAHDAEDTSAAANQLAGLADELKRLVGQFKVSS